MNTNSYSTKGFHFSAMRGGGLLAFLLILSLNCQAQKANRVEKFINNYEAFVNEVVATPIADFHGDTLSHIQKQQRCFMRRYRWYYDTRMSVDQLEHFNRLCGRYKHKMKVLNRHRRFAAAKGRIAGRFQGLFSHDNYIDTTTFDTISLDE